MASISQSVSMTPSQTDPKMIASELLANTTFAVTLYALIKNSMTDISQTNKVCSYPVGTEAKARFKSCADAESKRYLVGYHPFDITVVGGMAVSFYDAAIASVKAGRKLKPLKEYLSRNTTDMDIIWWPRIIDFQPNMPEEVITINSPGIREHVGRFEAALNTIFHEEKYVEMLSDQVFKILPNVKSVDINVSQSDKGLNAGVMKVVVYFTLTFADDTAMTIEMCDISIHDGGSSQITLGRTSQPVLVPMTNDPVYINFNTDIKVIPFVGGIVVNLPLLMTLVKQQLFAFSNLLNQMSEKCIINYYRIRYFLFLMKPRNTYTTALLHIFSMPPEAVMEYINYMDAQIKQMIVGKCSVQRTPLCDHLYELEQRYYSGTLLNTQLQAMAEMQQKERQLFQKIPPPLVQVFQRLPLAEREQLLLTKSPNEIRQLLYNMLNVVRKQLGVPKSSMVHQPAPTVKSPPTSPVKEKPKPKPKPSISPVHMEKMVEIASGKCTLPASIGYRAHGGITGFSFENKPEIKAEIENMQICKYYNMLELLRTDDRATQQLKRIKMIMHDIFDYKNPNTPAAVREKINLDTIKKKIESEEKLEVAPLKSILEQLPPMKGGYYRKRTTQRNRKRRVTVKRSH
jgi:hypothetical protein